MPSCGAASPGDFVARPVSPRSIRRRRKLRCHVGQDGILQRVGNPLGRLSPGSILSMYLPLVFMSLALTVPDAAEQKAEHEAIIARVRDAAVNYADRLQDFLCTQTTKRSMDPSGSGHWKLLETQQLELGYIGHKEHYRLLSVNGKTTNLDKRVKQGYFRPGGEFGSSLGKIFDPKAAAIFEWDREETSAGTRACVFRYRVPVTTTTLVINADADHVKMAHHGFVTADCDSAMVTRIQIETEPASVTRRGRNIAIGVKLDVRYGTTVIAGKDFLLPREAVEIAPFGKNAHEGGDPLRAVSQVRVEFEYHVRRRALNVPCPEHDVRLNMTCPEHDVP